MKAIVTRQNADGTYDNVGMNNRTLFSQYRTKVGLIHYGVKRFANGKKCRVELFRDNEIYGDPYEVFYVEA